MTCSWAAGLMKYSVSDFTVVHTQGCFHPLTRCAPICFLLLCPVMTFPCKQDIQTKGGTCLEHEAEHEIITVLFVRKQDNSLQIEFLVLSSCHQTLTPVLALSPRNGISNTSTKNVLISTREPAWQVTLPWPLPPVTSLLHSFCLWRVSFHPAPPSYFLSAADSNALLLK